MLQCTYAEVGAWFGVSKRTIIDKMKIPEIREAFEFGRDKGLLSLRRHQFRLAEKNAAMAIFLGKQYLGQRDYVALPGVAEGGHVTSAVIYLPDNKRGDSEETVH